MIIYPDNVIKLAYDPNYEGDQRDIDEYHMELKLDVDMVYELKYIDMYLCDNTTYFYLKEIPNKRFYSYMFQEV